MFADMSSPDEESLTRDQTALFLKVSTSTVIRYEKQGLRFFRQGARSVRYLKSDVLAFQRRHPHGPSLGQGRSSGSPAKLAKQAPNSPSDSIWRSSGQTRRQDAPDHALSPVTRETGLPSFMSFEVHSRTSESARLLLKVNRSLTNEEEMKVYRLCIDADGRQSTESGLFIGSPVLKVSAGIIDVLSDDVLVIEFRDHTALCRQQFIFRVDYDFKIQPTDSSLGDDCAEFVWPEISRREVRHIHQPFQLHESLKDFIQSPHRGWIQPVVNAQLADWKTRNLQNLIRYAPDQVDDDQIYICAGMLPSLSLVHLRHRLSPEQLDQCMIAAPDTAVRYAFNHMSARHIAHAVQECPDVLLTHAASKMTEKDLRACAYEVPGIAFEVRKTMPPPIHALLMSYTIAILGELFDDTPFENLQDEATKSLHAFPDVWLKTYQGDRERLLATLRLFLELDCGAELQPNQPVGVPNPPEELATPDAVRLLVRGRIRSPEL